MTGVVVVGADTSSLRFVRHALGEPAIEVLGIVPSGVSDAELAYGFATDSATSPFRGTVETEPGSLVLAGRYGRGGLRHDRIPLYSSVADAVASSRRADCLVVGTHIRLDVAEADGLRCVTLAQVPDPVDDTVSQLVASLGPLGTLLGVFASTTGASTSRAGKRERLIAMRGSRAGTSVSPVDQADATLAMRVDAAGDGDVAVTTLFLQFAESVERDSVIRRLRSASRGALAASVRLVGGPVGSHDVAGSTTAVIDVGAVDVSANALGLALFTDVLAVRTRIACALVVNEAVAHSGSALLETSATSGRNATETM